MTTVIPHLKVQLFVCPMSTITQFLYFVLTHFVPNRRLIITLIAKSMLHPLLHLLLHPHRTQKVKTGYTNTHRVALGNAFFGNSVRASRFARKKIDLNFSLKLAAIDVIFGSSRRQIVIFGYGYTPTKELDQLPYFSYKLSTLFRATKLKHEGEKECFK